MNEETIQVKIEINGDKAKKELGQLDEQAYKLREEMKNLKKGSDEYIAKQKQLTDVKARMKALQDQIGLTGLTLRQLNEKAKDLRYMRLNLIEGTQAWKENEQQLKAVIARQNELKLGSAQAGGAFQQMGSTISKYYMRALGVIASVSAAIIGVKKTVESFQELEKSVDNLGALTGLAGQDLAYLTEEAKNLSTATIEGGVRITQGATEIVDAFTKVGSARPELLKNKEALNEVTQEALILAAASDGELEPAVKSLAGVLNQFNAPASDARRIINALAAGSKEGAGEIPYLTDVIEKAGTVAADAGLSYETLIGTIETLAPRMTEPERAGTSLRNILLKLQQGADDTNPAVVGLETALDNMGKKNLSVTELVKIFGQENITAAQILIKNVEEVKKYTAAVTGTNVALDQAAQKTDNSASRTQQNTNMIKLHAIEIGQKLAPAYEAGQRGLVLMTQAALASIEVLIKYKAAVIPAIAALGVYYLTVTGLSAAKRIYATVANLATIATHGFNTAIKSNPVGLIISGLLLAVAAFKAFQSSSKSATTQLGAFYAEYAKEKNNMAALFAQLKATKEGTEQRTEALKKLKEQYGEYIPDLLTEKSTLLDIEKAQKDATLALIENIAVKSKEKDIAEVSEKSIEKQKEAYAKLTEFIRKNNGDEIAGTFSAQIQSTVAEINKAGGIASWTFNDRINKIVKDYSNNNASDIRDYFTANIKNIINAQTEEAKSVKSLDTFYNTYISTLQKAAGIKPLPAVDPDPNKGKGDKKGNNIPEETPEEKARREEREAEERKQYALKIQKDLEDSRIQLIESAREKEIAIEKAALARELSEIKGKTAAEVELRENLKKESAEKILEIEQKYNKADLDKTFQIEKERWDIIFDAAKEGDQAKLDAQLKLLELDRDHQLKSADLTEQQKANIEERYRLAKLSAEENFLQKLKEKKETDLSKEMAKLDAVYQTNLLNAEREGKDTYAIKQKYLQDELALIQQNTKLTAEEKLKAEAEVNFEMAKNEEDRHAKAIENIQKLADAAISFAQIAADAIFQINQQKRDAETASLLSKLDKEKQAELAKKGLTEKQKASIDKRYAQKEAEIKRAKWKADQNAALTQAIINGALAVTKAFAQFGFPAGLIPAALAAASTVAQVAIIKGEKMPEFSEGGATATGNPKDVAGIVHKNEYVIPAWLMQEPIVKNYVQDLESMRTGRKMATGGYTSDQSYAIPKEMQNDEQVTRVINIIENIKTNYAKIDMQQINEVSTVYNEEILSRKVEMNAAELDEESQKYSDLMAMADEYYAHLADLKAIDQGNSDISQEIVQKRITRLEESAVSTENRINSIRTMRDEEVQATINYQLMADQAVNEYKAQNLTAQTSTRPVMTSAQLPAINYSQAVQDIRTTNTTTQQMVKLPELDELKKTLDKYVDKMQVFDALEKQLASGLKTNFVYTDWERFNDSVNTMITDTSI